MADYPAFRLVGKELRQKYKVQVVHVSLVVHARVICIYLDILIQTHDSPQVRSFICSLQVKKVVPIQALHFSHCEAAHKNAEKDSSAEYCQT